MDRVKHRMLITGATGFIGSALVSKLAQEDGVELYVLVRKHFERFPANVKQIVVADIFSFDLTESDIPMCETIVHLAARAHVMSDHAEDAMAEFRKVNVDGTVSLARSSVKAGVKRFIFLSSIGVHGTETHGIPFSETSTISPSTPYAITKWEAEEKLREVACVTGLDVVIIRPPLVYGANAPGNFNRLLKLVSSAPLLPLGAIKNKRSFIAVENLVNFIEVCISDPRAANETFLIADGSDISTTSLVNLLAQGMKKPLRLFSFPQPILKLFAKLSGKTNIYTQLFGSLQIDIAKAKELLDWIPAVDASHAIPHAAEDYVVNRRGLS